MEEGNVLPESLRALSRFPLRVSCEKLRGVE